MIWEDNLAFIDKHNAAAENGEYTYTLGINEYADWSIDELVKFMNGFNSSDQVKGEVDNFVNVRDDDLPSTVDWVNKVSNLISVSSKLSKSSKSSKSS